MQSHNIGTHQHFYHMLSRCYSFTVHIPARQHSIIWEALRRQRVGSFLSEHLGTRFFQLSQLPHLKAIVSDSVGERPLDSVKSVKISSLDAARALHRVLAAASPVLPIKTHGAFFLPWQRMPAEVNAYCA